MCHLNQVAIMTIDRGISKQAFVRAYGLYFHFNLYRPALLIITHTHNFVNLNLTKISVKFSLYIYVQSAYPMPSVCSSSPPDALSICQFIFLHARSPTCSISNIHLPACPSFHLLNIQHIHLPACPSSHLLNIPHPSACMPACPCSLVHLPADSLAHPSVDSLSYLPSSTPDCSLAHPSSCLLAHYIHK